MADRIESGTFAQACEKAKSQRENLGHHEIMEQGTGEWLCARRSEGVTSMMGSFRVLIRQGYLFFFGDLGDFVFERHGTKDMLNWAAEAVGSPEYFREKVVAGRSEAFYQGDAVEFLRDALTDPDGDQKVAKDAAENLGVYIDDEEELAPQLARICLDEVTPDDWYRAWADAGDDEPINLCRSSPRLLTAMECLRWMTTKLGYTSR